jgi:hypothetical protein
MRLTCPLHDSGAPGQGEAGDDGVTVAVDARGEGVETGQVILADSIEPLGQPLTLSLGEDLSERTDVSGEGFQFGAWARTAFIRSCSPAERDSGCRRIQPATVRGEGGGAVTGSAKRRLARK